MRNLTFKEKQLILLLLKTNSVSLSTEINLDAVRVREIDGHGSLKFERGPLGARTEDLPKALPEACIAHDLDGVPVIATLFLCGDRIDELDISKADGTPIMFVGARGGWRRLEKERYRYRPDDS